MRTLIVILCLSLAACSKPEAPAAAVKPAPTPPSAEAAKALVAASPEFGDYQFTDASYSLAMKRSMMNEPAKKGALALRDAGWLRLSGDEVVLTAKAKGDPRVLVRPNGFVDFVPLAKKALLSVDAVKPTGDGNVAVDLTWTWQTNDLGAAFADHYAGERKATATLIPEGHGWTVLRIAER